MSRKKGKKTALQDNVIAANKWGCGCVAFILAGIIIAMVAAALMQS